MPKRVLQARRLIGLAALCAVLVTGMLAPAPLHAQAQPVSAPAVSIGSQGANTVIRFELPGADLSGTALVTAAEEALPNVRFGGYQLPIQYVTLAIPQGSRPEIQIQKLAASAADTVLQPVAPEVPPALDWQPASSAAPDPKLPSAPAFVFRSGLVRGQNVAVIAISPIYQENGVTKIAGSLEVVVPYAAPIDDNLSGSAAGSLQAATAAAIETVDVPVNAAALANSFKITVAQPGLQEVLYSQLGLASDPAGLQLTLNGTKIAVEMAGDRLRFYAPTVGDRWNATSAYWLTLDGGPAIETRGPVAGGPAGNAYEEGKWQDNRIYETGYRGADGDHWFHKRLEAPTTFPTGTDVTQSVPVTVPVQTTLPLRGGNSSFAIVATDVANFSSVCDKPYQYYVQGAAGGTVVDTQNISWTPAPACLKQATSTATLSTTQPVDSLRLRLNANGVMNTAVLVESVTWRRPVALDFQGLSASAEFVTEAGAASFTLTNLPANWRLYDVTVATAPQFVAAGNGGSYTLNQAAGAASRYLLANLGAVRQPAVAAHAPTQFGDVLTADAIYIGPAKFSDELGPLLALRQQQGYKPLFVDVQGIYDVYGYGQVSAAAIRNFLRHQSDWQNTARRISVVLAGDATYDPFAYGGIANETLVAAWMDEVDPYAAGVGTPFGEAACDACIAQLNGDNPLTGDNLGSGREWFAADVWIGRFPVRNEQEIADLVAKLVAYDTAPDTDNWRTRKIFLADNYIKAMDDQKNAQYDYAGDFASLSDTAINALPNVMSVRRIYYDPAPDRQFAYAPNQSLIPAGNGYYQTVPRTQLESWRISDVAKANAATIQSLSSGASLVAYNGHSNHFYYAKTEDLRSPDKSGWLLNSSEVSLLGNQNKPFVMLAMTCYTSQFVKPASNGTIDEWLIRAKNSGAIAVWGPTGLSVVSGHELLQDGFLEQLQKEPVGSQRLGNLVEAGYAKVLESGPLDTLMTFVLLGDPLTLARIPTRELYMPALSKH